MPHISRGQCWFNRILRVLGILALSGASFYYVSISIIGFLNYDVVTTIKTRIDQPTEFPTVTFCSPSLQTIDALWKSIDSTAGKSRFGYDSILERKKYVYENFESFKRQDSGICFRFNGGKNSSNHSIPFKNSTIAGIDNGLTLIFTKNIKDLVVWIHEFNSPPKLQYGDDHTIPFYISKDKETHLQIEKSKDTKLGKPYNQCYENVTQFDGNMTLINFILNTKKESYKQIKCHEFCFDLTYIQKSSCACENPSLGNVWRDCWAKLNSSKINLSSCTMKFKKNFYQQSLAEACSEYCPLECDSMFYSVTISAKDTPNSTALLIYYKSLLYPHITQHPKMELYDLISNVGGTLGLFVGISFVSLFEIFDIIFIFCEKLKKPSNREPSEKSQSQSEKIDMLFSQMNMLFSQMNQIEKKIQINPKTNES